MTESRKVQLVTEVDASGATQGFEQVKQGARDMAQTVAQAGQTAGKGLDGVADGAKRAADGLNREEGRMRSAIQRATLDLQTLGNTASQKLEAKISLQGLDAAKFQPYITALKQVEEAQRSVQQSQQTSGSANSFINGLKQQADAIGKTKADLLEMQAAQLGLTAAAGPYIAKLREAEAGHHALGLGAQFSTQQVQGLVHSVRGAFDSIASGQSPVRALAVETGRLSGTFGGVGNAVSAVTSLITPFRAAMVAGAAAVGVLGLAMAHAESVARELNTVQAQLSGTGRSGLFSTKELDQFIRELSKAPGVSRDTATAIVSELSKVHEIGGPLLKDLGRLAVDYAKATGQDIPAATKQLAQAFADPVRGAKELDKALGSLTSDQQLKIEKLMRLGDLEGAQNVLSDVARAAKGLANEGLTPLQKSFSDLGNAWKDTLHAFDQSDGLKNLNALLGTTVEAVAFLVKNMPKFGGLGTVALSSIPGAGLTAAPANVVTSVLGDDLVTRAKRLFTGEAPPGPDTSLPTGNLARQDRGGSALSAKAKDESIKRTRDETTAYASQAQEIEKLVDVRKRLTQSIKDSISVNGSGSDVTKDLQGRLVGVNERIAAAQKKGGGGHEAQQVLDAQLQQSVKAAQDALTEERDQAAFSQRYLQGVYAAGELSIKDFYDEKRKAIEQGTAAEIASLEKERTAVQAHLAATQKTSPKDASAIVKDQTRLNEIDAQEAKARQKGGEEIVTTNQEAAASFKQLSDEVLTYRANLLQLQGDEAGAARLRNQIADRQDKVQATRSAQSGTPISQAELDAAKKGRDDQIALNSVKTQTSAINQLLQIQEDRIALAQSTGAIGEIEALTREGAARSQILPKLEEQLQIMEKLSKERPNDLQLKVDVESFRLQVDKLKAALDPLKDKFDTIFKDAGAGLFSDLMNGTKPAQALKNFGANLSKQINDTVSKELSNQVFGKDGAFGGAGGFFADLFGGKDRNRPKASPIDTSAVDQSLASFRASGIDPTTSALVRLQAAAEKAAGAVGSSAGAGGAASPDVSQLVPPTADGSGDAGDFARFDRTLQAVQERRAQDPLLAAKSSGEQSVMDMFRDASKSSDTLSASNTQAASTVLQLARSATNGGNALSSLPSIIQSIIAAASSSSAASGGGGILGSLGSLLGGGGSSSAFAAGGTASSGFGSGLAFGEEDLGLFLSSGGYTGDKDPSKVAGIVHGKEYVFSAPAVEAIGLDRLERLHERAKSGRMGVPGYSGGGYVNPLDSTLPQTLWRGGQYLMQAEPMKAGNTYVTHHHYDVSVQPPPGGMNRATALQTGRDIGRGIENSRRRNG